MNGCQLRTIQELLGHSDVRMTVRYSHLSPEHLQNAVNTLDLVVKKDKASGLAQEAK
jgi:site-specific recombinase XerD